MQFVRKAYKNEAFQFHQRNFNESKENWYEYTFDVFFHSATHFRGNFD